MQAIISFFTALFLMTTSFFTALPHTFMLDSQTPEQTITDVEEVLALYQEYAAKNEGIKLRYGKTLFVGTVMEGMPGNLDLLTADDLVSAKAEYYRDGKTLVIYLDPKLEPQAVMNVIGIEFGTLFEEELFKEIIQANGKICVDTSSGKIVAANYYMVVTTAISVLQYVVEINLP